MIASILQLWLWTKTRESRELWNHNCKIDAIMRAGHAGSSGG
jgi:hypothetical protein